MTDIDINPSSMGPIFGVWIGPTIGVPEWTIHHWAIAILVVESSCYMALIIVTRKRNSSAAAKYELHVFLPAEQRCSK